MTLSNLPLVTPLPRRDSAGDATPPDQTRMAELRSELASLTATIAGMTAKSAAQAEQFAASGAASLRSNIEARPWSSLGVAATAGALFAVAIVPKNSRGFHYAEAASYNAGDITAAIRRAIARGVDDQPITSRFEKLVESISSIDATALTSSPAYDTAKTWLQALVSGMRKA